LKRLTLLLILAAAGAMVLFPHHAGLAWQIGSGWAVPPRVPQTASFAVATPEGAALVAAAETQVGVVRLYDPAYVTLAFPGGDIRGERGVCTDVLVRALRVAHGIDLQLAMNRDMQTAFGSYPDKWGLSAPDPNIDHRRVPNLRHLLARVGAERPASTNAADFLPGDIITSVLPGGQTHLAIVTHHASSHGARPFIVHNIGAGTRVEDRLFAFEITGHYRLDANVLDRLRALSGP
jgi:uncharacterized protein